MSDADDTAVDLEIALKILSVKRWRVRGRNDEMIGHPSHMSLN